MPTTTDICLFYLPCSGGKFIANCLALSRHVLCNDATLAKQDLDSNVYNEEYYQFKLKSILSSLPKNFLVDRQWKEFTELDRPWNSDPRAQSVVKLAREKNRILCHIAHFNDMLDMHLNRLPDLKICKLVNFKKFNYLCFTLKIQHIEGMLNTDPEIHAEGFDHWLETSRPGDITVDMDSLIYQPDTFLPQIKQLYDYFGLEDFRPDLLTEFYNQYKPLHRLA